MRDAPMDPALLDLFAGRGNDANDVAEEMSDRMTRALATLSPREMAVTRAVVFERQSFAEIAAELGVSKGTVQTYWHRAKAKLMVNLLGSL